MSWVNSKAEASEVPVKRKTEDVIEQMNNYNIRDGITKRDSFVYGNFFEYLFCRYPDRIIIVDYEKRRLYYFQELHSQFITGPVSQKRYRLTDDIPGGAERNSIIRAVLEEAFGLFIIRVFRA